jgi:hypothetical protein
MTYDEVINYSKQISSNPNNRFSKYWTEDGDYREEHQGDLAEVKNANPKEFVGTADSTIQLYGYTGNVVIRAVNIKDNWMYCEAPSKEINLHYQEMGYGPHGKTGYGGMLVSKTVMEYIPILYDLNNFQSHELQTRFNFKVDHDLSSDSIALLRGLLNQSLTGDKIIQWLMNKFSGEENSQVLKQLKIVTANTGGRFITFGDRALTIGYLVSTLLEP